MANKSSSTHRMRIHLRDQDFTLYLRPRGLFTILAPAGRYSDTLLGVLGQDFLSKPGFLAVDLSGLDAVTLPLIRALRDYAVELDPARGRMVFINPPDRIRGLLKLVDPDGRIPVTFSERDLEGDLEAVDGRVRRAEDRLQLVRTMLASHPCWQLTDRDNRWLCPFCVTLRPDVRFVLRGTPSQAVVTQVLHHLSEECSTYVEGATDGWPFEVLERVIRFSREGGTPPPGALPPAPPTPVADTPDDRRRRLLPRSLPSIDGCALDVYSRAASPLTGDFFDVVRLPGGRRALVVGDVSGGGIDPGVLMGAARKLLSLRLREIDDLSEALGKVNDDLCDELDQESYVTVAVAVPDPARGELLVARAGHPAPFLARASGELARLETPGPVLGFVPTASFEQGIEVRRVELGPGDVLLMHTDGLEELKGAEGERFGADRLAELLRAHAAQDVRMLLASLVREAERFAGAGVKQVEDLTAICVKAL